MAAEILENEKAEHTIKHDLESIYYCFLYLCTMFEGPLNKPVPKKYIPIFIKFWSEPENWDPSLLGFFRSNFISCSDYNAIIDAMSDYMHDLGLCI